MPDVTLDDAGPVAALRPQTVAALPVLLLLLAYQIYYGVLPGLQLPAGDFANYYTAARVAVDREDLTPAYTDVLWFQQRIDAAGLVGQLGSFVPHPPATALVLAPLAGLDPLAAKRVWTGVNVALALACAVAISRLARVGLAGAGLALAGTGTALANDLAFGQLYLLVLLSLAVGLLLVDRDRPLVGGLALGLMLPIKPFAAPLLVAFALRREWRVLAGAAIGAGLVTAVSVAALGWSVHEEFARVVLPALASSRLQDPFHPLWQSFSSLARRMFLAEPTLNPTPALALPLLAGLIPAAASAAGWSAVLLAARGARDARRLEWAAVVAASLALAPGGASYHMVLVALPVALVAGALGEERTDRALLAVVVAIAALLALPLASWLRGLDGGWTTPLAYPRLWLLAALLAAIVVALARRAERAPSRAALATAAAVVVLAGLAGAVRARPAVADAAVPVEITAPELVGRDRTVATQPSMRGGSLVFLAADPADGRFELFTPDRKIGRTPIVESTGGALSPDRRRLAFVATRGGNTDVYLRDLATGAETRATADPGVDRDPCWESATSLVFASDRGRGLGYTTLYRVAVPAP